jgi:hypothetical protein
MHETPTDTIPLPDAHLPMTISRTVYPQKPHLGISGQRLDDLNHSNQRKRGIQVTHPHFKPPDWVDSDVRRT